MQNLILTKRQTPLTLAVALEPPRRSLASRRAARGPHRWPSGGRTGRPSPDCTGSPLPSGRKAACKGKGLRDTEGDKGTKDEQSVCLNI